MLGWQRPINDPRPKRAFWSVPRTQSLMREPMWKTTQGLWGPRDVKPTSPSLHCALCAHTCHHQSLSFQAASSRPPFLHGPQATDPSTQSDRPLTAHDHTLPAPAFTFFFFPGPCLKSSIPFPNPSLKSLVQVQQHHVDLTTMPVRTALSPPIQPHLLLGAHTVGKSCCWNRFKQAPRTRTAVAMCPGVRPTWCKPSLQLPSSAHKFSPPQFPLL